MTRSLQKNAILSLGKLGRAIENETVNGTNAYTLLNIMDDLRKGVWSELRNGASIDTYGRNLQKVHFDHLNYLMTVKSQTKRFNTGGNRSNFSAKIMANLYRCKSAA